MCCLVNRVYNDPRKARYLAERLVSRGVRSAFIPVKKLPASPPKSCRGEFTACTKFAMTFTVQLSIMVVL